MLNYWWFETYINYNYSLYDRIFRGDIARCVFNSICILGRAEISHFKTAAEQWNERSRKRDRNSCPTAFLPSFHNAPPTVHPLVYVANLSFHFQHAKVFQYKLLFLYFNHELCKNGTIESYTVHNTNGIIDATNGKPSLTTLPSRKKSPKQESCPRLLWWWLVYWG